MTANPHAPVLPGPERLVPGRLFITKLLVLLAIVGVILSVIGATANPTQFAYSWFFAFYFALTIALGSFFWVTLHYACDSEWSVIIRRSWENVLGLLPALFVLFLPILFFAPLRETLWQWMQPVHLHDPEWNLRAGYLNMTFFWVRVLAYFGYFICAGLWYRHNSVRQDTDGDPRRTRRMHDHSYLALVIFGILETFLGFDWLMGLYWRWYSSLFGVYNFTLCAQSSMAAGIVLMALLRAGGHLKILTHEHFYLAGKLLFGFTIFWAYIAFGQFLLIWYGNIPEETIFYNDHNRGAWKFLTYFIIVGKFIFPVIFLLAQDTKKSLRSLAFMAAWILFMHAVELYWFIMPYAHERTVLPSWQDFVAFLTVGSMLGYLYLRIAASASLVPTRDPRLAECLTVTN
jgi:hypothetical protein